MKTEHAYGVNRVRYKTNDPEKVKHLTKLGVIREVIGIHERQAAKEAKRKREEANDDCDSVRGNADVSEFQRSVSPSRSPSKQVS